MHRLLKRPAARWAGLALLAMALIAVGFKAWQIYALAFSLRRTAAELSALADQELSSVDPDRAGRLIHLARTDAAGLQEAIAPLRPLTDGLGWVPQFGPTLASVGPLAYYTAGMTLAADELLAGMEPLLELAEPGGSQAPLSRQAFDVLQAAQPRLASASAALASARLARQQLEIEALPASLREQLLRLDPLLPLAEQGLKLLQILPQLLGGEGTRAYLLLAQNYDELRATGGFISGVGLLVVEKGEVLEFSIGDSYAVDDMSKPYPTPPEPLRRYMLADRWLLRDANWSPDFPTAARQAQELYELSTGLPSDGVIAFDQTVVQRALAAVGPLEVPGAMELIGAENVESYMHQAWSDFAEPGFSREWWLGRKDFMGALGSAILAQVQSGPDRGRLLALARAGMDLLREKHLLIYLEDPAAQAQLAELGWDGAIRPGRGDFLMLVDSNVGFNKVDPWIERSIRYQVDLSDPSQPAASLRLEYRHSLEEDLACTPGAYYGEQSYTELQRRCYWNYFRVYVPGEARPLSGRSSPVPAAWLLSQAAEGGELRAEAGERDTLRIAGILVLPANTSSGIELSYALPAHVLVAGPNGGWVYRLQVQKQPGTGAHPLEIIVKLPEGHSIDQDEGWRMRGSEVAAWSGRLRTDLTLELYMLPIPSP